MAGFNFQLPATMGLRSFVGAGVAELVVMGAMATFADPTVEPVADDPANLFHELIPYDAPLMAVLWAL